jgi:hypothetical protein
VRASVVLLLLGSLVALTLAPLLMPDSYSVVTHSVSESAAQGVPGAWLARSGFVLFGLAVLLLAVRGGTNWGLWARLAHGGFAVSIIAAAVLSHAPFDGSRFDEPEDWLHSAASFGVGLFFTIGVLVVALERGPGRGWVRLVDWAALAVAVVIPLAMANIEQVGLAQRLMFLVAYLWYGIEAWQAASSSRVTSEAVN